MYYLQDPRKTFNEAIQGRKLVLFGASRFAVPIMVSYLHGYDIAYFCDNDPKKWGTTFMGTPVCSPQRLTEEDRDKVIVLITSSYKADISCQLDRSLNVPYITTDIFHKANLQAGMKEHLMERYKILSENKDKLDKVRSILEDDQSKYLFDTIIDKYGKGDIYYGDICQGQRNFNELFSDSISNDGVYVDVGAYTGDTIMEYFYYTNNLKSKIYAFEPDPLAYRMARNKFIFASDNIRIFNYAISNENAVIQFNDLGDSGIGRVNTVNSFEHYIKETCPIKAVRLDDIVKEKVSFLKINMQGYESEGLLSAQRILREDKPNLAVCAYMNQDDLFKIPLLIHELMPEYKIYLRFQNKYKVYAGSIFYAKI